MKSSCEKLQLLVLTSDSLVVSIAYLVLINHYSVLTSDCLVVTIDYLVLINHYLATW